MADAFGRGWLWPLAAGTAADPTTTYVASTVGAQVAVEGALHCRAVVTGANCRAIQIRADVSNDGGTTYRPWRRHTIVGAIIGSYDFALEVPDQHLVRLSARRWGGSAASRLAVYAVARQLSGRSVFDGQPPGLHEHQALGVECYGDGAGAAAALAAGPGAHAPAPAGAATQQWIPTGEADTLVLDCTIGGVAATTVELEVRESTDDVVTTLEAPAVSSVVAGVISQTIAQEQLPGTLGLKRTREIPVRPGTAVLVLAQRTGGGAATLYAEARFYKFGGAR